MRRGGRAISRLRRRAIGGIAFGVIGAIAFANVSSAAGPTIEGTPSITWSPSTVTIEMSETVTFKNPSTTVPHGVQFTGGPAAPSCTGVPGPGQTNWEGSCTFSQNGSYPFVCTVHASMTGTINVGPPGLEAPTVTTGSATVGGDTSATLSGTVNPHGQATEYFFKYGTTLSYGSTTSMSAVSGSNAVPVSAEISGLAPGTTYHYLLVAESVGGTGEGGDRTVKTSGPPTATTSAATTVTVAEATLHGTVNPGGHATSYYFEYGKEATYGQKTSSQSAGSGMAAVAASATVTGLAAETTYHFRLVAEGSTKATGSDLTFKTGSESPPPKEEERPPPPQEEEHPIVVPPIAPLTGPALGSLKVTPGKSGAPVRGSVQVLPPGGGGRLMVTLTRKGVPAKKALAGRISRSGVAAGKVSFSVALNGRAKSAVRTDHRLPLKVTVTLTPPGGAPSTLTKSIVETG